MIGKVARTVSPRPTMGAITLKRPTSTRCLFSEPSDSVEHTKASSSPLRPTYSNYTIREERTPTGYGKVLVRRDKTYKPDKSIDESIESTPPTEEGGQTSCHQGSSRDL